MRVRAGAGGSLELWLTAADGIHIDMDRLKKGEVK